MTTRRSPANWHPAAVLLGVQLVGVVLYPFADQAVGRAALGIFGLIVLFLAVRAVQASPALTCISVAIGVPLAVLSIVQVVDSTNGTVVLWSALLFALFYFYTSYALIRYLYEERDVTSETLFATGATFTVVAWAFAYTYQAIQAVWPGAFADAASSTARPWFDLLYVSFTTLTSVGLSDIVPVLPQARSAVMIEEVAGLLFVALIVSRIAGLTVMRMQGEGRRRE